MSSPRPSAVLGALALAGSAFALSSCGSILVTRANDGGPAKGVPYALPKTVIAATVTIAPAPEKSGSPALIASLGSEVSYVGDPRHQYVLEHRHSAFHDDLLTIGVNAAGLLTMLDANATSKVNEALDQLSSLALEIAKIGTASGGAAGITDAEGLDQAAARAIDLAVGRLVAELRRYSGKRIVHLGVPSHSMAGPDSEPVFGDGSPWVLDWRLRRVDTLDGGGTAVVVRAPARSSATDDDDDFYDVPHDDVDDRIGGVLVRTPQAWLLDLELRWTGAAGLLSIPRTYQGSDGTVERSPIVVDAAVFAAVSKAGLTAWAVDGPENSFNYELSPAPVVVRSSSVVIAPDHGPVVRLTLERVAFAATDYKLTFKSGMVATARIDRDNSAVNVIKVPITIAKAIVSIPAELVQLKIDMTEDEAELSQAVADLQAQLATQGADSDLANTIAYNDAVSQAAIAADAFAQSADAPFADRHQKWTDWLNKATTANAKAAALGFAQPFDLAKIAAAEPQAN